MSDDTAQGKAPTSTGQTDTAASAPVPATAQPEGTGSNAPVRAMQNEGTQNVPAAPPAKGATIASNAKEYVALIAVVMILILFTALMAYLLFNSSNVNSEVWGRLVYVYGSAEAVLFTAVGWIFGREVSRQAVNQAVARADDATARAEESTAKAADLQARGKAAVAYTNARAQSEAPPSKPSESQEKAKEESLGGVFRAPTKAVESVDHQKGAALEAARFMSALFD